MTVIIMENATINFNVSAIWDMRAKIVLLKNVKMIVVDKEFV